MRFEISTSEVYFREASFDTGAVDIKTRTIKNVSLSSDIELDRGFYREKLEHTKAAIDMERAVSGLPLLFNHDKNILLGRVENIRLVGKKLRGDVRFADNAQAEEKLHDAAGGFLPGISVGYRVMEWSESDTDDLITVTRWKPFEASFATIEADHTVGVNRSFNLRGGRMDEENQELPRVVISNERQWLLNEKRRRQEIRTLFMPVRGRGEDFAILEESCLDDPMVTIDKARAALLDLYGGEPQPLAGDFRQAGSSMNTPAEQYGQARGFMGRRIDVAPGRDDLADFEAAATDAILLRSNVPVKDPHPATRDLSRMRLSDIAEIYLRKFGRSTSGLSRENVIRQALSTRTFISHSTSDFPRLLENISAKALMVGFTEAPATHREWVRKGTLPDFREGRRVTLSDFDDLELVYENGEYKHGSFGENYATVQLQKFGKLFSISWEALVNDDTAAFTQVPRGIAAAALRAEQDAVYAILTGGTSLLMPDSVALFASGHANHVANGSGAVPSVTTLNAAFTAMAIQQGPKGAHLNIVPRFLIVPRALEATARALAVSMTDPAGATVNAVNPFFQRFEVVADSRLDANDPARWYAAADPALYDTVEVAYLNGQETPFLETQDGWTTDGTSFKVRHVFGVTALDYRGLYHNDGN